MKDSLCAQPASEAFFDPARHTPRTKPYPQYDRRLAPHDSLEDDLAALYASVAQQEPQAAADALCALRDSLEALEERLLLCQDEDGKQGALLMIRPASSEPADEDWAMNLQRMYGRWAESRRLEIDTFTFSEGNRGFRETNLEINGRAAFAMLRGEAGIHRLRDQRGPSEATASAEVMVFPRWSPLPQSQLDPETLEVTATRSRGMSCGTINRSSSAVRVLHRPSGRSIGCEWFRSQRQNRDWAIFVLEQLLSKAEEAPRRRRTYTLGAQPVVRDHCTGLEEGDTERVFGGYLDPFVRASLREPLRLLKIG